MPVCLYWVQFCIPEALTELSHVPSSDNLNTTFRFQGCILGAASGRGEVKWNTHSKDRKSGQGVSHCPCPACESPGGHIFLITYSNNIIEYNKRMQDVVKRLNPFSKMRIIYNLKKKFIYLFGCIGSSLLHVGFLQLRRAGTTLRCGVRASHCGGFSCCRARALGAQASVVVARGLQSAGSVVVVHGLHCSAACGIFLDQGSNPCPLQWQADS